MDNTVWGIITGIYGLLAGSFAGAQMWRLRLRQLVSEKEADEAYDKAELNRLKYIQPKKGAQDRSHCLRCGQTLRWYDLIPLISWVSTRGRCRYCQAPIGWFEPLIELSTAFLFVISYVFWPYALDSATGIAVFILWLLGLSFGTILYIYDKRWFLLPDRASLVLAVIAMLYAALQWYSGQATAIGILNSLVVIAGLYAALYYFSAWRYGAEATWVGFGDVKLSVALGLFLLNWQIAFLAVFLANLLGTIAVAPGLIRGNIDRKAHIPFGPFLLLGTFIAVLFGERIITWYLGYFLG